MIHRPKPGEDEDDILRQQEEFLRAQGVTPSAAVINKRKTEQDGKGTGENVDPSRSSKKFKSKFASSRSQPTTKETKNTSEVSTAVLGEVTERPVSAESFYAPVSRPSSDGFPRAFLRDKTLMGTSRSIFAQQMAKMKKGVQDVDMQQELASHQEVEGDHSYMLSGSGAEDIHEENLKKLGAMSAEEIKDEQDKLLRQLDPQLVEFVRRKRARGRHEAAVDVQRAAVDVQRAAVEEAAVDVQSAAVDEAAVDVQSAAVEEAAVDVQSAAVEEAAVDVQSAAVDEAAVEVRRSAQANKWLHMDILEQDKLQWTTDVPPVQPVPPHQPYAARFNFQGVLLQYLEEDVEVSQGLHHHGEEPHRPGYTLQELCQLSRSSVLQQRVLALSTIANILHKTKCGYYDECLQTPLLNQVLESDMFLLLRFSLDDNTEAQLTAALAAITNLLCNQPDEVCLGRLLGGPGGLVQPSLGVHSRDKSPQDPEQREAEAGLKDHHVLRLDVIKGALRTDLILRLRYILEVMKPSPKAVINVLEILARIARHSYDSTLAVTCCPRLMTLITHNFVPRDWSKIVGAGSPADMTTVYGVPLVEALKLLRVVAARSRSLASDLVHKYSVMDAVISYVSVDPSECGLPHKEALRLSLESLYLWQTLLAYNIATQQLSDLFPVLMRLLQFHLSTTSTHDEASFGQEHGAALLSLLGQAVRAAHTQERALVAQPSRERIVATLRHAHVSGYWQLLELCVHKWLAQMSAHPTLSFSAGKLVGAALQCLSEYITCFFTWPGSDVVSHLEQLQVLFNKYLAPFMTSPAFSEVMHSFRRSSCLLDDVQSGTRRDPAALPSLGALCWGGHQVVPLVGPSSQFLLVQGLVSLLDAAHSAHKGLDKQCVERFLGHAALEEYLGLVASGERPGEATGWFLHLEVSLLCRIAQLAASCAGAGGRPELFHAAALCLTSLVPRRDVSQLSRLFSSVMFAPQFFRGSPLVVSAMQGLQLSDGESASRQQLLTQAVSRLAEIRACYQAALSLEDLRQVSACCLSVSSITADLDGCQPAVPADWCYAPVLALYDQQLSGRAASDGAVKSVLSCLQWLLLAECVCPQAINTVSVTARFCRLCTVFLAASDLFLTPAIHSYLQALLKLLLTNNSQLDFTEKIPGLTSFYDLYTQMLDQFAGVSYGDKLFGQFVLVPLQQRHSVDLRKLVWSEYVSVLRLLPAQWDEPYFPCEMLLEPPEVDPSLLACYLNALMSGVVSERQSPVLYHAAAHHVGAFVAAHSETTLARQLRASIDKLGNTALTDLLLARILKDGDASMSTSTS